MKLPEKPLLRWAGSKRQLLVHLARYWSDENQRYIEPFAGSACLFFRLQPQNAILSDINGELIFTYQQVKAAPDDVAAALDRFKPSSEEYYRLRAIDLKVMRPAERAARLIYLNRYCFNGLYRTNRQGVFNVPYGGEKVGQLPSLDMLKSCQLLFQRATLIAADFAETLKLAKRGDFVYLDPPYTTTSGRVFNEYDASAFRQVDIVRLRKWMDKLTAKGVRFVVSYAHCSEARILWQGYESEFVDVRRNIAGFAKSRRTSLEVLITNRSQVCMK
jgi:DNA adenine methylase